MCISKKNFPPKTLSLPKLTPEHNRMKSMFRSGILYIGITITAIGLFSISGCQPKNGSGAATVTVSDSLPASPAIKVGYLNSLELLSQMPGIAEADKAVSDFAKKKERSFNSLANQYQTKLQTLQQNGPAMLQAEQEKAVQELQGLEQRIQQMQANSQTEVAIEKERLYAPVLARADSVIKLVGQEQGYTFIYDAPGLLYVDTTLNILPMVKRRLGLEAEDDSPAAPADSAAVN